MEHEVNVLSYNLGLTSPQVDPDTQGQTLRFYKFTRNLRDVIRRIFTRGAETPADDPGGQPAHALFLCELGSQFKNKSIAASFRRRLNANLPQQVHYIDVGYCDQVGGLTEYLMSLVRVGGLDTGRYGVWANAPYGAIWDSTRFSLALAYDLF